MSTSDPRKVANVEQRARMRTRYLERKSKKRSTATKAALLAGDKKKSRKIGKQGVNASKKSWITKWNNGIPLTVMDLRQMKVLKENGMLGPNEPFFSTMEKMRKVYQDREEKRGVKTGLYAERGTFKRAKAAEDKARAKKDEQRKKRREMQDHNKRKEVPI